MPVVPERIVKRLEIVGKSQVWLAKEVGMRQQGINSIVAGRSKRPGKLREIAVALLTSQEYLLDETDDPAPNEADAMGNVVRIPLFDGSVSAGRLADTARDLPPAEREIVALDLGKGDFFGLPVKGDSMDRVSPENSIIIVDRRDRTLQRGKPFVFAIRGEMTYKLWEPSPPRLEPFSWNPANRAIFIDKKVKMIVVGRVRRTILDL